VAVNQRTSVKGLVAGCALQSDKSLEWYPQKQKQRRNLNWGC